MDDKSNPLRDYQQRHREAYIARVSRELDEKSEKTEKNEKTEKSDKTEKNDKYEEKKNSGDVFPNIQTSNVEINLSNSKSKTGKYENNISDKKLENEINNEKNDNILIEKSKNQNKPLGKDDKSDHMNSMNHTNSYNDETDNNNNLINNNNINNIIDNKLFDENNLNITENITEDEKLARELYMKDLSERDTYNNNMNNIYNNNNDNIHNDNIINDEYLQNIYQNDTELCQKLQAEFDAEGIRAPDQSYSEQLIGPAYRPTRPSSAPEPSLLSTISNATSSLLTNPISNLLFGNSENDPQVIPDDNEATGSNPVSERQGNAPNSSTPDLASTHIDLSDDPEDSMLQAAIAMSYVDM